MLKKGEWPEKGEMVIGNVTRVNPYSAFISLEEYENKEGMIHISEVAGKWVRDIRDFVKVGEKVVVLVMAVDREKGHIALSLKRVRKYDAEEKMREFKREMKAEKMISMLAKKLNMKPDIVKKDITPKLIEIFGETFKAFQMSMTPQGYDLLKRKGISEEWASAIKATAEEQMEAKEVTLKGVIELKCFKANGVEIIKNILFEANKKYDLEIKYVSAPKYSLNLKTKDAKAGERRLKEALEETVKKIKELGGEGSFKVE
jgi:translation initiation factor 2 subunit 1